MTPILVSSDNAVGDKLGMYTQVFFIRKVDQNSVRDAAIPHLDGVPRPGSGGKRICRSPEVRPRSGRRPGIYTPAGVHREGP